MLPRRFARFILRICPFFAMMARNIQGLFVVFLFCQIFRLVSVAKQNSSWQKIFLCLQRKNKTKTILCTSKMPSRCHRHSEKSRCDSTRFADRALEVSQNATIQILPNDYVPWPVPVKNSGIYTTTDQKKLILPRASYEVTVTALVAAGTGRILTVTLDGDPLTDDRGVTYASFILDDSVVPTLLEASFLISKKQFDGSRGNLGLQNQSPQPLALLPIPNTKGVNGLYVAAFIIVTTLS